MANHALGVFAMVVVGWLSFSVILPAETRLWISSFEFEIDFWGAFMVICLSAELCRVINWIPQP
jgi:hypothetical protein